MDREALRVRARPGLPWPSASQREAWRTLTQRDALVLGAKEAEREEYPLLTATQFMAYVRTGDRQRWEAPYFKRRQMLIRLALGEAAQADGRFLDRVTDGLWLLAEESSWVISAHNTAPRRGKAGRGLPSLPDPSDPVIDLFAAQSAATVSLCCHLLRSDLETASTQIMPRMRREVEARILRPFMTRDDFWWMGYGGELLNNWTPWILANVLICLLFWVRDRDRLARGLFRVIDILDRYLRCLPEDGALDEGVSYWNMAGASLLDCLELLHHATGGWLDVFAEQMIRAIARFPLMAHIQGPYFLNFADCDAMPWLDGERIRRFGERTGDGELLSLGQSIMDLHPSPGRRIRRR